MCCLGHIQERESELNFNIREWDWEEVAVVAVFGPLLLTIILVVSYMGAHESYKGIVEGRFIDLAIYIYAVLASIVIAFLIVCGRR